MTVTPKEMPDNLAVGFVLMTCSCLRVAERMRFRRPSLCGVSLIHVGMTSSEDATTDRNPDNYRKRLIFRKLDRNASD